MLSKSPTDSIAFDIKASSLIEATQHLSVPQILVARRMTLTDPESLRWASPHQLHVVFDVILNKSLERYDRSELLSAVDQHLEPLLPPEHHRLPEDVETLTRLVGAILNKVRAPNKKLSDAEVIVASFETLLSRRLPPTPKAYPRPQSPYREPPPLFAVQGNTRTTIRKAIAPSGADVTRPDEAQSHRNHHVDFTALFDDTIIGHIKSALELLQIPANYPNPLYRTRLPFVVAPEFTPIFEDVLRRFILPQMRSSRQVKALANAYNWAEVGGEQLIAIMQGSEINNPVLHNWDLVWNTFKNDTKKVKESPWTLFQTDATICNYYPPDRENIRVILDMIRYEPEAIDKCLGELSNLAQQEFAPTGRQERARDGALRDGILKWSDKLPDYVGEFIAIKAAFLFPACTPDYMRALVNNYGRSEQDRRRNAPYLSQFVADQGA